jgi:hypothetical protein
MGLIHADEMKENRIRRAREEQKNDNNGAASSWGHSLSSLSCVSSAHVLRSGLGQRRKKGHRYIVPGKGRP